MWGSTLSLNSADTGNGQLCVWVSGLGLPWHRGGTEKFRVGAVLNAGGSLTREIIKRLQHPFPLGEIWDHFPRVAVLKAWPGDTSGGP